MGRMCGRFGMFATSEELANELESPRPAIFNIKRRYNIASGQWFIIVRPEKGERVPSLARWGLVPSWFKDPEAGPNPINARAEGTWLDPENKRPEDLLQEFPAVLMEAWSVGSAVENVKNDSPELIEKM